MLVMNVFNDEETTDIVNNGVLVSWVVVYGVLILSVITNRMFKF